MPRSASLRPNRALPLSPETESLKQITPGQRKHVAFTTMLARHPGAGSAARRAKLASGAFRHPLGSALKAASWRSPRFGSRSRPPLG